MKLLRYAWVLPFLVVLYIYGSESLSVFQGSPEHYRIVSALGLSNQITSILTWLSVVIEVTIIIAAALKPSGLTFSIAAIWPWVPRVISALTGGDLENMEFAMSSAASIAALLAGLLYKKFANSLTRTDAAGRKSA